MRLLSSFLLLFSLQVLSADSILLRGSVTDTAGQPIADAEIAVEHTQIRTTTDRLGRFELRFLRPGTYHCDITATGFTAVHLDLDVASVKKTILIRMEPEFRQELVVTGTKIAKRLAETPVRTELVTRDQIEATGSRTLADSVEYTTGVRVESNCQNCNFSQIRMLGLNGSYSEILVDGQNTFSSLAHVYGIEQIPARMIDRIEIVKGGGSALYGAGAVAGVVNVKTKMPYESGGVAAYNSGWMDGNPMHSLNGLYDWVSSDKNTALTVFGQDDAVPPVDLSGDGYTEVSKRQLRSIGARLNQYLMDHAAHLSIHATTMKEDRRGGNALDRPEHQADIAESVTSERVSIGASWRHSLGGTLDYALSANYADMDRDSYYGAGQDPNAYGMTSNPLWIVDGSINYYRGKHTVTMGLQYEHDEMEDSQPAYNRLTSHRYRNVGWYFQDDWSPTGDFSILTGLRIDRHSELSSEIISPRIALRWMAAPGITLRTSVSSGFQAPKVFDEDLHISQVGGEGLIIENAEDLKEETAVNYLIGAEVMPPLLKPYQIYAEFNLFYTRIEDQFLVVEADDPTTDPFEFSRQNFGEAEVYGGEVNVGYRWQKKWDVQLGYVRKKNLLQEPDPDFSTREEFRTPDQYANLSLFWNPQRTSRLFLGYRYTGTMKSPHYAGYIQEDRLETLPEFHTLDASYSHQISLGENREMEISLGGNNLTNTFQKDIDQGPDRDSTYVYGPRFPRRFFLNVQFNF
ncbi:TonB-dependent receptor [Sulfidibacter corallicola]|uniref:TonB-dependent receptor n=1 Tax=Sulfidibacter corallicola TaxID=2818388 RepID=A0A8A4THA5_SULCO|nr:TonB-dependent receptor [Sulfidibacter corallicola]QTD49013.1 TonB-dependent receptor [Sulfidibacter corallicola]